MTIRTFAKGASALVLAAAVIAPSLVLAQSALTAKIDAPANNARIETGEPVLFRGSAVGAGANAKFLWSFSNDDSESAGPSVSKTFAETGTTTVTLRVVDRDQDSTDSIDIVIVDGDDEECTPLIVENDVNDPNGDHPKAVPSSITTNSATIVWNTCEDATSRVVYDTVQHPTVDRNHPNFGYQFSQSGPTGKRTQHEVQLTGLQPNTTYYFRVLSAR